MKNKKVIIFLSLFLIIVLVGFSIFFIEKNKNENEHIDDVPKQEEQLEPKYEFEILENEHSSIYDEHCLNELCIELSTMFYREGYGGMTLNVVNKSDEIKGKEFMNIIFITQNGDLKKFFYHDEMDAHESYLTEITFTEKEIIEATNYRLEEPSSEELMNYYSNMAN